MGQTNEKMTTFSNWLCQKRADLGISLLNLQKVSHVDDSTLSRVERQLTEPSLYIIARICYGLGVPIADLLGDLQAQHASQTLSAPISSEQPDALTIADIQLFADTYFACSTPEHAQIILQEMANETLRTARIQGMSALPTETNFFAQEFARLLDGSNLLLIELRDPQPLDGERISRLFAHGGALTLKEVGAYIKTLRERGILSAAFLQTLSKNAVSVLLRLENDETDHITFKDALTFSEELGSDSVIQQMFWRACAFHWQFLQYDVCTKFPNTLLESQVIARSRLVSVLFTLARWQEYLAPDDKRWLHHLRTRIAQIRQKQSSEPSLLQL